MAFKLLKNISMAVTFDDEDNIYKNSNIVSLMPLTLK